MKQHNPRRFAHRGVAQAAPENTLGAFQAAVDLGLEGIELDVRLSRDGVPVVVHDANLTRLTCGHPTRPSNALVAELDWADLAQIELPYANHLLDFNPASEDEFLAHNPARILGQGKEDYPTALAREPRMAKLLTLAAYLDWLAALPNAPETEIELCAEGAVLPVFHLLEGHPAAGRCIVFSGNPAIWEEMHDVCAAQGVPAGVRLGANIRYTSDDVDDVLECFEGIPLFEVGLNAHGFGAAEVKLLQARGIEVLANLGDSPAGWAEMNAAGCYGFKTNFAGAYTAWKEQQA